MQDMFCLRIFRPVNFFYGGPYTRFVGLLAGSARDALRVRTVLGEAFLNALQY